MLLAFLTVGVFWGGPKSTLLVDGKLQYVAFFSEYIRQLKALELPLFSRYFGPGMGFFSTWAYYLASPVNLLMVLFEKSQLLNAIYVVTLIKVGLCGLSFNVFTQKALNIRSVPSLLFSTAYALCGTIVYNLDNLQWLDGMIWLPILILGIERMREKGRCAYLPFVIALLVISNFYAAVLCAPFCVLYVFYVLLRSKREEFAEKRLYFFLKVLFASLIGLGMASFLIIPIFYTLLNDMGLLGQGFPSFRMIVNPLLSIGEMFFARKNYISNEGVPTLYSSVLVLVLLPFFFFAKGIALKKKIAAASVLIFLFFVPHISSLNFIFHGLDEVGWFHFRYTYVFSFFVIALAAEGYRERSFRFSEHTKFFIAFITSLVIAYLGPIVLFGFSDSKPIVIVIFFINLVLFIAYTAILDSKKQKLIGLCAVLFVELLLNTAYIQHNVDQFAEYANYKDRQLRTTEIEAILTEQSVRENGDRIALKIDTLTINDTTLFGIPGIEFYSSAANRNLTNRLHDMGYVQNLGIAFEISDNGGTILSDALLSISGEIIADSPLGSALYRPSVFPARHLPMRERQYAPVYIRHKVVLPIAYTVDPMMLDFDVETASGNGPIKYTDALVSHMLGHEVETSYEISPSFGIINATPYPNGEWMIYIPENPNEQSLITVDVAGQGEQVPLYLYSDLIWIDDSFEDTETNVYYTLENKGYSHSLKEYDPTDTKFLLPIGAYEEGSTVRISVVFKGCMPAYSSLTVFAQNESTVERVIAPLQEKPVDFRWTSSSSFGISTHSETEEIVFISIPYDRGWSASRNGQPQEILNLAGGFMGVRVPAGEQDVDFSYFPRGLQTGLIISAAVFISTVAFLLIRRYSRFTNEKKSKKATD